MITFIEMEITFFQSIYCNGAFIYQEKCTGAQVYCWSCPSKRGIATPPFCILEYIID